MNTEREEIKSAIDELYATVHDYRLSDCFKKLVQFCAKFKTYAPYNAMLIREQRPGAKYVLSAARWKDYNRLIKTDSRPIIVLMPFGPVHYLFDVEDTIVESGCEDRFPPDLAMPYAGDPTKPVPSLRLKTLIENLPLYGIYYGTMITGERFSGKLEVGHLNDPKIHIGDISRYPYYTIKTHYGSSESETFAAIVHELAHLFCRHISNTFPKHCATRTYLTHKQEEFEAETVAWLVCQRLGVADARSYSYLAGYLESNAEIPEISIEEIMKATHEIETMLERKNVRDCFLYKKDAEFKAVYDEDQKRKRELRKNKTT